MRFYSSQLRHRLGARLDERTRAMTPARRLRFTLALGTLAQGLHAPQARLLDAGAGEGLLAEAIAQRHPAWHVVAADLAGSMLRRGEDRVARRAIGNVEFRVADLTGDLGTDEFDAILAIECLGEIPDDRAAVRAMARALRPGGLLLAHVPTHDWRPALPGSERTWRHQARHGYRSADITVMLEEAGLEVTSVEPTARGTVRVAQELADRMRGMGVRPRALIHPLLLAGVRLERWGVTWGHPRALFVEARRRPEPGPPADDARL
jgi:SAM-dependent methyltransferase